MRRRRVGKYCAKLFKAQPRKSYASTRQYSHHLSALILSAVEEVKSDQVDDLSSYRKISLCSLNLIGIAQKQFQQDEGQLYQQWIFDILGYGACMPVSQIIGDMPEPDKLSDYIAATQNILSQGTLLQYDLLNKKIGTVLSGVLEKSPVYREQLLAHTGDYVLKKPMLTRFIQLEDHLLTVPYAFLATYGDTAQAAKTSASQHLSDSLTNKAFYLFDGGVDAYRRVITLLERGIPGCVFLADALPAHFSAAGFLTFLQQQCHEHTQVSDLEAMKNAFLQQYPLCHPADAKLDHIEQKFALYWQEFVSKGLWQRLSLVDLSMCNPSKHSLSL